MSSIVVSNVGKAFKQYPNRWSRLADWLIPCHKSRHRLNWVLQDINFTVNPGEAVGIIGINGAGKSTLLKIITGTTQPTTGSVKVNGSVAALLELGMGFHPDFTGRQNAFMAGQLLGYNIEEVVNLMPEIEAFAEIGEYIDRPVRVYSSGMLVRLAFSVATMVRPDILIIDEALAVGDIFFQQKCFDRIKRYREQGTTLLFVSHSLDSVYALCNQALLIENGRLVIKDQPKAVIDLYNAKMVKKNNSSKVDQFLINDGKKNYDLQKPINLREDANQSVDIGSYSSFGVTIRSVRLLVDGNAVGSFVSEQFVTVEIIVGFSAYFSDPHIGFQVKNNRGEPLFMTNTHAMGKTLGEVQAGTVVKIEYSFYARLAEGTYTITTGVANHPTINGQFLESLARLQNIQSFTVLRNFEAIRWAGIFNFSPQCSVVTMGME